MSDLNTREQALQARGRVAETPANVTTVQFVDGLVPETEGPKRPRKQHHNKSRNGCQRCRTRRVKVCPQSFISFLIAAEALVWLALSFLSTCDQNLVSFPFPSTSSSDEV